MPRRKLAVVHSILVFTLFVLVVGPVISSPQASTAFSMYGSIGSALSADYTITNSGGNYQTVRTSDGTSLYSGSSAVSATTAALSDFTSGKTIQYIGNVAFSGGPAISKACTLDFTQSTVSMSGASLSNCILINAGNVRILGGGRAHPWNGMGSSTTAIRYTGSGVTSGLVDNVELTNFPGDIVGVIWFSNPAKGVTIQNCYIHDNGNNYGIMMQGGGFCKFINTVIANNRAGVLLSGGGTEGNIFDGCEFYGNGNPDIYMDTGDTGRGYNEVKNCYFHDPANGGTINIKSNGNIIHDNRFENMGLSAVGIHFFGQYSRTLADNNQVYNNTFTNVANALWIGAGSDSSGSTSHNRIHDNTFVGCNTVMVFNPEGGTTSITDDNWIYYNRFTSCTNMFTVYAPSSQLTNTIIAYNDFGGTVNGSPIETGGTNTMVYGNVGLADFNVPSPLPISPR